MASIGHPSGVSVGNVGIHEGGTAWKVVELEETQKKSFSNDFGLPCTRINYGHMIRVI
jgi:hypothetical protein